MKARRRSDGIPLQDWKWTFYLEFVMNVMNECLCFVCTLNRSKERHLESIGHTYIIKGC